MNEMSRRQFLYRFSLDASDREGRRNLQAQEKWQPVGRISEMSPGSKRQISVAGRELWLQANGEGIWLTSEKDQRRFAIRLAPGGKILANFDLEWPPNRILSHSSGEVLEMEQKG